MFSKGLEMHYFGYNKWQETVISTSQYRKPFNKANGSI